MAGFAAEINRRHFPSDSVQTVTSRSLQRAEELALPGTPGQDWFGRASGVRATSE
jgi:hypothetical protein